MTFEQEQEILNTCKENGAIVEDSVSCYFDMDCDMFISVNVENETVEIYNSLFNNGEGAGFLIERPFSIDSIAKVYEAIFGKEFEKCPLRY